MAKIGEFDVVANVDHKMRNSPQHYLNCCYGNIGREVNKVSIKHRLVTRNHKYLHGGYGQVAKRLTITIDFGDSVMLTRSNFADDICGSIVDAVAYKVNDFDLCNEAPE